MSVSKERNPYFFANSLGYQASSPVLVSNRKRLLPIDTPFISRVLSTLSSITIGYGIIRFMKRLIERAAGGPGTILAVPETGMAGNQGAVRPQSGQLVIEILKQSGWVSVVMAAGFCQISNYLTEWDNHSWFDPRALVDDCSTNQQVRYAESGRLKNDASWLHADCRKMVIWNC